MAVVKIAAARAVDRELARRYLTLSMRGGPFYGLGGPLGSSRPKFWFLLVVLVAFLVTVSWNSFWQFW